METISEFYVVASALLLLAQQRYFVVHMQHVLQLVHSQ